MIDDFLSSEFFIMAPKAAILLLGIYTLILSNTLGELFGCRLQYILKNSMILKHIVGIILFFIVNIYTDKDITKKNFGFIILITLLIYLWFMITVRTHLQISIIIVSLLLILFTIEIYINRYTISIKNVDIEKDDYLIQLKKIQTFILLISILITFVGFILYYLEKSKEYGSKFSLFVFIFGKPQCKNYTPSNVKYL